MADNVTITANVTDATNLTANVTEGVSITSNVSEGTTVTANVVTGAPGRDGVDGSAGISDHSHLSNIGTNTHAQIDTALARLASTSGTNTGDQDLSSYATTSALTTGLATKASSVHTHSQADVSSLTSDLAAKQATLVSGTNIKTINGTTLLGSGDIAISGGGGVTDHGALTGLADDDHTQYHTDARGDARYNTKAEITTALAGKLPVNGTNTGDIYVDYIGGKTDANVDLDLNGNFLGTLSVGGVAVPTISSTSTLTNKSLQDSTTFIVDDVDATKKLNFQASAQTTGTTNVITFPNGTSMTVVGTGSTQTLTNKTLTAPTLSGTVAGTYTLGGTPTFPAAVTQNTSTQTLTNKTLSTGTAFDNNIVPATALATSAITLGYTQITSSFTTTTTGAFVDVTGLSVTVTVPAGGRNLKLTAFCSSIYHSVTSTLAYAIREGTTTLNQSFVTASTTATSSTAIAYVAAPSAGSHTYKVSVGIASAGTLTVNAGVTNAAYNAPGQHFILAELI